MSISCQEERVLRNPTPQVVTGPRRKNSPGLLCKCTGYHSTLNRRYCHAVVRPIVGLEFIWCLGPVGCEVIMTVCIRRLQASPFFIWWFDTLLTLVRLVLRQAQDFAHYKPFVACSHNLNFSYTPLAPFGRPKLKLGTIRLSLFARLRRQKYSLIDRG